MKLHKIENFFKRFTFLVKNNKNASMIRFIIVMQFSEIEKEYQISNGCRLTISIPKQTHKTRAKVVIETVEL